MPMENVSQRTKRNDCLLQGSKSDQKWYIYLCRRVNITVTQGNTTSVNWFIQANMSGFAYIECIAEECWLLGRTLSHRTRLLVYTSHKYSSVSSTVRNRLRNKSFTKRTLRLLFSACFLTSQFLHTQFTPNMGMPCRAYDEDRPQGSQASRSWAQSHACERARLAILSCTVHPPTCRRLPEDILTYRIPEELLRFATRQFFNSICRKTRLTESHFKTS